MAKKPIMAALGKLNHDPLAFVLWAFGWGKGELANFDGPDKWQSALLDGLGDKLASGELTTQHAVASGHGVGKLHGYNCIVPTPSGNRRWGDLAIGDYVFGSDGTPTRISQTTHYKNVPMYRVTFDDKSTCEVSSGHLWNVRGRQERRKNLDGFRTIETIDLVRLGVKRPNGIAEARQWEIPIQGAAEFNRREVKIHPYLMGLWLCDGTKGSPAITKSSESVVDRLKSFGYDVRTGGNGKSRHIKGMSSLITDPVFSLGSPFRYIPDDYKFNSVECRMELFRGLCDGDGEAHKSGSIGYSSTSKQLAEDVLWLARSLGCKAIMQAAVKQAFYANDDGVRVDCRDCYRVTINAPFNPFTHDDRRAAYKPSEMRYLTRWIDRIDPIENSDGMCITVDADDGLYQANDFIVTHNSSTVSWLILWAMLTAPNTRGVITANTDGQLRTKTWAELAKWHRLLRPELKAMLNYTATALYVPGENEKSWRIDAVPWSKSNPAAFAGLHNKGNRILLIFDEASEIDNIIWEVAEGAMTDSDTEIMWLVFGNPTRNSGRFRECFGRFRHRWTSSQIDSRTARMTNKTQIDQWIADYGEDSDFVRVRVKGQFPRAGSMQLISSDTIAAAVAAQPHTMACDPVIIGVDVARFGDDQSVICVRRGRDAREHWESHREVDTMTLAGRVATLIEKYSPDAVFVDETGVGGGVVDRLRQLGHDVVGVNFGGKAITEINGERCANKRAEIWCKMADWLKTGGAIPDDLDLISDLTGVEYGYNASNEILLEKKDDMKKRGLASPDKADALAVSFALPVLTRTHSVAQGRNSGYKSSMNQNRTLW